MSEAFLVYPAAIGAQWEVGAWREYRVEKKPPLGLLYIAANLKEHGVQSRIFDQSVTPFRARDFADRVAREQPLFVGLYSDSYLKPLALTLTDEIKQRSPATKVVVGGPAAVESDDLLAGGVDVVCHGEGDMTVREIADAVAGKMEWKDVAGISFQTPEGPVKTAPRALVQNLDSLPFPAWDAVRVAEYHDYHIFGMRQPYMGVMASRGCPYRCTFCGSPGFWSNKYRVRTTKSVVDEVEILVRQYGVRYIGFKDDIFAFFPGWADEFVDEMKARQLRVPFSCMVHPFSFRDRRKETLIGLRQVGLDMLIPGLQSTDQKVLKEIKRRGAEPAEVAELITDAKGLGISTILEFILGLPGDTEEVFRQNLEFALTVRPHYAVFYALAQLPGTDIAAKYRGKPVIDMPDEEIREWARRCQQRFYLNPRVLAQNLFHVLWKRPSWFLVAGRNMTYFADAAGLKRAV